MTAAGLLEILTKEYETIRTISQKSGADRGCSRIMRSRSADFRAVLRLFPAVNPIYEFLKTVSFENLPEVYDTYILDDGYAVLEEYIDGLTVAEVIENGLYTKSGAVRVISDVCDALTVLHENGFVHRDVKPENVMISKSDTVKLIDFDVSRKITAGKSADTDILGTVGYAPPEQYGIAQSDPRSDIYAAGVLLNVMLTGKHPSEQLAKGRLGKVVLKCTQIDPNARYQTAEELKKAL